MDWVSGVDETVDLDDLNAVRNNFGANWGGGGQMMMSSGGSGLFGEDAMRAALRDVYLSYLADPSDDNPYENLFHWEMLATTSGGR